MGSLNIQSHDKQHLQQGKILLCMQLSTSILRHCDIKIIELLICCVKCEVVVSLYLALPGKQEITPQCDISQQSENTSEDESESIHQPLIPGADCHQRAGRARLPVPATACA